MTMLAPTLEAFFSDYLMKQRRASPHTVASYRDSFCLLLVYLQSQSAKKPDQLEFEDLDASIIAAFLDHLSKNRANSVRTRNARLAALRSFFGFAILRHPEHAGLIQRILAVPSQRATRGMVDFLSEPEINALLASPDCSTRVGRRDHALLTLALQTGLRVSELSALRSCDVELGFGAHVRTLGKGRKERCTPLTKSTVRVLRAWMREETGDLLDPVFRGRSGGALSHDAIQRMVAKHAVTASERCPTLAHKRVSPHVLRHTTAMTLLAAGVDQSVIALWLGHERIQTTDVYIHGDITIKERTLARTAPLSTGLKRYRAPDSLLNFLEGL